MKLKSTIRSLQPAIALAVVLIVSTLPVIFASEKIKVEEVVSKHLASIGDPEAVSSTKTRVLTGEVKARLKLTNVPVDISGPAQSASEGNKFMLTMSFNSNNYPHEKLAFDGEKLTLGALTTGGRTPLGNFLMSQDVVFKQGLIAGVLSSGWPLLKFDPKKPNVSYAGLDKIDGKPVHKLRFRDSGNLKVNLYFDAETFQHVRTIYEYVIPARQGATPEQSASQRDSRYKLVEDFSDFQPTGKLVLPHGYKIQLTIELPERTQMMEWAIDFQQFSFDQPVDAQTFNLSAG